MLTASNGISPAAFRESGSCREQNEEKALHNIIARLKFELSVLNARLLHFVDWSCDVRST